MLKLSSTLVKGQSNTCVAITASRTTSATFLQPRARMLGPWRSLDAVLALTAILECRPPSSKSWSHRYVRLRLPSKPCLDRASHRHRIRPKTTCSCSQQQVPRGQIHKTMICMPAWDFAGETGGARMGRNLISWLPMSGFPETFGMPVGSLSLSHLLSPPFNPLVAVAPSYETFAMSSLG